MRARFDPSTVLYVNGTSTWEWIDGWIMTKLQKDGYYKGYWYKITEEFKSKEHERLYEIAITHIKFPRLTRGIAI